MNMFGKYVPYEMEYMHSDVYRVVRAVAWHWKVPGSTPGEDMGIFFFEERTGPPILKTDLKSKIFFSKN